MSQDTPRLDLDRARAALVKARSESTIAVRAPRPADLSRLREEEARRHRIESRAGSFRMEVRSALGLADTSGPYSALPVSASGVLGASLCDADVCMPDLPASTAPRPGAPDPVSHHQRQPAAGLSGEAEPGALSVPADEPAAAPAEADEPPAPEAPRKRRKFLGIF
ncbi:MAG: hypothetical protein ACK4NO_05545 [Glycocaulis sp.]